MLPTPAGYYLSFGEVKPGEEYARSRSAFSPCILTDEKEMLAFWGRRVYRMEKVVDYDDIVEGKDFFDGDTKLATKNIPADGSHCNAMALRP